MLLGFTTLMIFVTESLAYYEDSNSIDKLTFVEILKSCLRKAFVLDLLMFGLYKVNKRRQMSGKPPF